MSPEPPFDWQMVEAVATSVQAIILSASAIAAVWLFYFRGQQERRRAALVVVEYILSKEFNDLRAEARRLIGNGQNGLFDFGDHACVPDRAKIIHVLNYYEYVCRRAAEGAISNQVFRQHIFEAIAFDWSILEPFAQKAREHFADITICANLERWVADEAAERRQKAVPPPVGDVRAG